MPSCVNNGVSVQEAGAENEEVYKEKIMLNPQRLEQLDKIQPRLTDGSIDYVRFTYCDVHGIPRGKLVPARNAASFLRKGIGAFIGMQNVNPRSILLEKMKDLESMMKVRNGGNLVMFPDLETFRPVPWVGSGEYTVAEVLCDLRTTSLHPVFTSNRTLALKQLDRLKSQGLQLRSGVELEFMLLDLKTSAPVYSGFDFYSNLTLSGHMEFFSRLEKGLSKAGININDIHTEPAQGQFEINYEPPWGILGADWPFMIRQALKESALKEGLLANFMGRPWSKDGDMRDHCGNGAHFNHSIWDLEGSRNLFRDEKKPDKVSNLALHWVAGLVKNMDAMTALLCPTVNCYRRIEGPWGPNLSTWGVDDRLSTIRVKNFGKTSTYIENRLPSGLVNPYLALAATIAAGMDGVINKLEPPPQRQGGEKDKIPRTLEESLVALENSTVMREALGENFVHWFCALKREGEIAKLPNSDMKVNKELAFAEEMEMYGKFM